MDLRKSEDIFKLYNYFAMIFRANMDENDNAARKVTERYQDLSHIDEAEEKYIKAFLKDDTKSITKPYTRLIGNTIYRTYLIDEGKLRELEYPKLFGDKLVRFVPGIFEEIPDTVITIINKDAFIMKDMYNNEEDKRRVIILYDSLFRECTTCKLWPSDTDKKLATILGLLFYYQATCGNITKEEYCKIRSSYHLPDIELKAEVEFDLVERILKVGDIIPNSPIYINESSVKAITTEIQYTFKDSDLNQFIETLSKEGRRYFIDPPFKRQVVPIRVEPIKNE